MENKLIKNTKFRRIATNVKPDAKKRILLSKAINGEGITYHVYCNEIGQIILDPQISIPVSEAWLYRDEDAIKAIAEGLKEASEGKISKVDLNTL